MKKLLLLTIAFFYIVVANAQTIRKTNVTDANDRYANVEIPYATTTKLPKGTVLKKGKIVLKYGYKANYADSNRIIVVQKPNGEISGAFKCKCESGTGRCGITHDGGTLQCVALGGCNCTMEISVGPPKGMAITLSNGNWKKLIIPSANTKRQKNEDPDRGGEIIKKKDLQVKQ